MEETITSKLKDFLKKEGITQQDIASKLDVAQPTVANLINGKKKFGKKTAQKWEDTFGISSAWLLTGKGDMLFQHQEKREEMYYTCLIPQSAMGGSLIDIDTDGVLPENCEKVVSPIANIDFAITIYGDSMSPEYPPGCRALIKKIDPDAFIAWGNVYVLDTVNGVILKELQPSKEKGKIICHSQNPTGRFKDFEVSMNDVRGIYRVLACITTK